MTQDGLYGHEYNSSSDWVLIREHRSRGGTVEAGRRGFNREIDQRASISHERLWYPFALLAGSKADVKESAGELKIAVLCAMLSLHSKEESWRKKPWVEPRSALQAGVRLRAA